ncbi:UNVERIFIED_CONTAM: hypothetical protein HDU68_003581 [Siphonaria sp. JEL0065]|nr:hypothetical protein HDU68_003581 [Siphonaria sp. JEL0065]
MLSFFQKRERLTLKFRAKLMLALGRKNKEALLEVRRGLLGAMDESEAVDSDAWSVSTTWSQSTLSSSSSSSSKFTFGLSTPTSSKCNTTNKVVVASSALVEKPPRRNSASPQTHTHLATPVSSTKKSLSYTAFEASPSPLLMPAPLVPAAESRKTIKKTTTNLSLKESRMKAFFRHGIMRHAELRMHNRGLWLPPVDAAGGGRWNLGNLLHISDKYIADLDMDLNQSVPQPKIASAVLPDGRNSVRIQTLHIKDSENLFDRKLFDSAQKLVFEQFAKKNVNADLEGVLDDDFTLDVVIDPISGQVVGAVEYVFMKRYLWIDAIAVREDVRGLGVGCIMMERLRNIASIRSKEMLCFGLHDVCGWYHRQGFSYSSEFPQLPWRVSFGSSAFNSNWLMFNDRHIGRFLVWKPTTTAEQM